MKSCVNESAYIATMTVHDCWRPCTNFEVHVDECTTSSLAVIRLPSRSLRPPDNEILLRLTAWSFVLAVHSLLVSTSALYRKETSPTLSGQQECLCSLPMCSVAYSTRPTVCEIEFDLSRRLQQVWMDTYSTDGVEHVRQLLRVLVHFHRADTFAGSVSFSRPFSSARTNCV